MKHLSACGIVAALTCFGLQACAEEPARPAVSRPVPVKLVRAGAGYRLERGGQPYLIKGAGGSASMELLRASGANSVRTWGADNMEPLLDEAHRRGMTVTIGIWLGHEPGFNYNNAEQVAEQYAMARRVILSYRDHPALLMWGIGNEMEGFGAGDNAAIWSAVNNIASMAKSLDPNHPTMTVISEVGGERVKNIHRLCPDIDVVGINSYGGASSIPTRYVAAGGSRPYVLTEFGPLGPWESGKTAWGAPLEMTSTEKAAFYRRGYEGGVAGQALSVGSYAFLWGHKQEGTATWFGMLLPDGNRLGPADTMAELWSGQPPANRVPVIASLTLTGADTVEPGAPLAAALTASDPDNDAWTVQWVVQAESAVQQLGGATQAVPAVYPEAVVSSSRSSAEVRAPVRPGGYRVFAYVRDGKGGAAVANVPFLVRGSVADAAPPRLPMVIYEDAGRPDAPFLPTGWMGNVAALKMEEGSSDRPHAGPTCIRCDYTAATEWGGVAWQWPANDWGDQPAARNVSGAKALTFWARGARGGEMVNFSFGLLGADKKYPDSARGALDNVKLTPEWTRYSIGLAGKDLTRVKTGFAWTVAGQGQPVTFYLDDIRFE